MAIDKPKQRIMAIDLLRGFALLGILLMNMSSFAMPGAAYSNPVAFGGEEWWNLMVFNFSYIFANQKMMALFSMLFGASVMLICSNMERRGQNPLKYHYSRNIWLLIFGLLHWWFLWEGDILSLYAGSAFVLFWFRKLAPKWQLTLGILVFLLPAIAFLGVNAVLPEFSPAELSYAEQGWAPSQAAIQSEIEFYRGDYGPQLLARIGWEEADESGTYSDNQFLADLPATIEFPARAFGMMLIGMAMYSWGVLTAKRSREFYARLFWYSGPLGLLLAIWGLAANYAHDWAAPFSLYLGRVPNQFATILLPLAYIALVMLWSQSSLFLNLQTRLMAVGRTALTNYIAHSAIGTAIFYGFGLGLFGYLDRLQQLLVILAIWSVQLIISPIWLRHFKYGPLEWLWRSLSHFRWQPLRKNGGQRT